MPMTITSGQIESIEAINLEDFMFELLCSMAYDTLKTFGSPGKVVLGYGPQSLGKKIVGLYEKAWGVTEWNPDLLGRAMADLKNRLGGQAKLAGAAQDEVVVEISRCPFGNDRIGSTQEALCIITSNVFGAMAKAARLSKNIMLAELPMSISRGDDTCVVVTRLGREPNRTQDTQTSSTMQS